MKTKALSGYGRSHRAGVLRWWVGTEFQFLTQNPIDFLFAETPVGHDAGLNIRLQIGQTHQLREVTDDLRAITQSGIGRR
jgi:hypothetical protein